MIKKHLTACSVLLALIISAKLFFNSGGYKRLESFPKIGDTAGKELKKETARVPLNFADEHIPLHNPKVATRLKKALHANSFENLQTNILQEKAVKWFPVIEPILKRYKIPADFKYVPLVESGLKRGTSSKGASGYWQFMPQTARDYGLKVNADVDERWNMQKSTVAACKYLRELYGQFHNWTLVAAAYNVGENRLHAQINRQGHRNYFKLKLNSETSAYVYRLISMKEVIERPAKYGYTAWKRNALAKAGSRKKHSFIKPHISPGYVDKLAMLQKDNEFLATRVN